MPAPVGSGAPGFGVGCVASGAADGVGPEPDGSGFAPVPRSDCASARLPPWPDRPDPGTVPPLGSADAPFGPADREGPGFAPSSPTLIQPVDAAIVNAVTAAHRTGADNWRTGGTSGA
ncbi:hypothetical protein F0344_16255 [Streptomyces finlayi]|uniref:Uncharacterized protein n=1 Tax=Streptomyces finlayi TaxID=67296 RepID=A0A7G7BKW4_9ACTN|nr:hypothetical protein [Streptomyces finlayi]QNE75979.1 hypothetical protein F0344_16255 [Streptomyces finlayi]